MKDVSDQVTQDLTSRLKKDPVALERFYRSFGLDPVKLRTQELWDFKEFFPDTPVKMLKDVCQALQLYDLVELLDKIKKPKALRPALPLKEIEKLPSANNRPTKIYTKAEVLIINSSRRDGADCSGENFGSFFKVLNMQSQVTTLTATSSEDLYEKLKELGESKRSIDNDILKAKRKEIEIKECLENKTPYHWYEPSWMMSYSPRRDLFYPEISEAELLKFLEVVLKKKDELAKKRIPLTEEIKQKEEELKRENEELKMNVSSHFDKWIEHAHDKGRYTG